MKRDKSMLTLINQAVVIKIARHPKMPYLLEGQCSRQPKLERISLEDNDYKDHPGVIKSPNLQLDTTSRSTKHQEGVPEEKAFLTINALGH